MTALPRFLVPTEEARPMAANDDLSALARLGAALALFPDMKLPQLQVFLAVAQNEGVSQKELVVSSGLRQNTVSRYLIDLLDLGDARDTLGLVDRKPNPRALRESTYTLTEKGRALAQSARRAMEAL
jgi:DNA-binding MarR family transcriptional regulator